MIIGRSGKDAGHHHATVVDVNDLGHGHLGVLGRRRGRSNPAQCRPLVRDGAAGSGQPIRLPAGVVIQRPKAAAPRTSQPFRSRRLLGNIHPILSSQVWPAGAGALDPAEAAWQESGRGVPHEKKALGASA